MPTKAQNHIPKAGDSLVSSAENCTDPHEIFASQVRWLVESPSAFAGTWGKGERATENALKKPAHLVEFLRSLL